MQVSNSLVVSNNWLRGVLRGGIAPRAPLSHNRDEVRALYPWANDAVDDDVLELPPSLEL
jgi:hypothetical protein